MRVQLLAFFAAAALLGLATTASAETYFVSSRGDDAASGSDSAPWKTLQRAADTVAPGDRVIVRPGNYRGFNLETSGTASARIRFTADAGAIIDADNAESPDGINLEGSSFIELTGFTVTGATRAGIRAVNCSQVLIANNRADENGRWGIFTAFCDDLRIEANETSRSGDEHGIYVSNSGDRPVIRRNLAWGNNKNGIHMNGDITFGGDGIISGALVENNTIYDNGRSGGSAINADGVQDSTFRNNLIYGNFATGIALYRIDGGGPSRGNRIVNNTIVMPGNNRWCILLRDGATGTLLRNNILWNTDSRRGAIDLSADSRTGLDSNYNAVVDRFTVDDASSYLTLGDWQRTTGQDGRSLVASPEQLFVDPAAADYHLRSDGPAIDAGDASLATESDLAGNARVVGRGVDLGALEHCAGRCVPSSGGGGPEDTPPDDSGSPTPPGPSEPGSGGAEELRGGCSTTSGARGGLLVMLLALLLIRRRALR